MRFGSDLQASAVGRRRVGPSVRKTGACVGVAVVALAVAIVGGYRSTASAATGWTREDSFESGAFSTQRWSTKAASFRTTEAHDNRRHVRLAATGAGAYLTWPSSVVLQGQRGWSARAWFKAVSHGSGQSVGLLTIRNKVGVNNADLFIDPSTGRCRIDLRSSDKALSGQRCDDNRWHLVEMQGDFGATTYTLSWRLDGVTQPSIASTGQPPTTVSAFWVGDSNPKTFVLDVDDVVLRVADTTPPLLGSATSYR